MSSNVVSLFGAQPPKWLGQFSEEFAEQQFSKLNIRGDGFMHLSMYTTTGSRTVSSLHEEICATWPESSPQRKTLLLYIVGIRAWLCVLEGYSEGMQRCYEKEHEVILCMLARDASIIMGKIEATCRYVQTVIGR